MRTLVPIAVAALLACSDGATTPAADDDLASDDDDITDDDLAGDDEADDDLADDDATDDDVEGPWRSTLYPEDWTPASTDAEGRYLPDFSYAGYRNRTPNQAAPPPHISFLGAIAQLVVCPSNSVGKVCTCNDHLTRLRLFEFTVL